MALGGRWLDTRTDTWVNKLPALTGYSTTASSNDMLFRIQNMMLSMRCACYELPINTYHIQYVASMRAVGGESHAPHLYLTILIARLADLGMHVLQFVHRFAQLFFLMGQPIGVALLVSLL